jgi:hypothetical protein
LAAATNQSNQGVRLLAEVSSKSIIDSRQLLYFYHVAKNGSFSRAEGALDAPQPVISRHIAKLEDELGLLLLDRNGRGVTLTPFGDEPVPRAPPDRPWPGRLPQPAPAVLLDAPVELLDADGTPVEVTDRGMFTAAPVRLDGAARYRGELSWWAGPWPMSRHGTTPCLPTGRVSP